MGDFINRGPQSVEVLSLVKSWHEEGKAVAVLGNHEFRLIQDSVAGKIPSEYEPFISWLRTLPLFFEMETIRIVQQFGISHPLIYLEEKRFPMMSSLGKQWKKNPYKKAVNRILSGIKINIPDDLKLIDRFGVECIKGRLKW